MFPNGTKCSRKMGSVIEYLPPLTVVERRVGAWRPGQTGEIHQTAIKQPWLGAWKLAVPMFTVQAADRPTDTLSSTPESVPTTNGYGCAMFEIQTINKIFQQ